MEASNGRAITWSSSGIRTVCQKMVAQSLMELTAGPRARPPGGGLFSRPAASAYRARRYRPLVRSFGVSWVANGRAGNIDGHFIVWCGQNHPGALRCGKREVSPNLCRGRRKRRLHLIQIEAFERAQSTYDRAVARPKLAEELPAPR